MSYTLHLGIRELGLVENLWASIELMYVPLCLISASYSVQFISLRSESVRFSNHGPDTFMWTRSLACSLAGYCVCLKVNAAGSTRVASM